MSVGPGGKVKPNSIVKYKPSNPPLENHHGLLDVWANKARYEYWVTLYDYIKK